MSTTPIENDWLRINAELVETCLSGRRQMFRIKVAGDRTFIDEGNAQLILETPRKELQAKLCHGVWVWENMCPTCRGEPIQNWWSPICHEHDKCNKCGIHHDQVKQRNHHATGWICPECVEKLRSTAREAALKEAKRKELTDSDCSYTDKVTCPYCFHEMEHEMDSSSQNVFQEECSRCGGQFEVEVEFTVTYTSSGLHPPEGYDEIVGADDEED